MLQAVLTVGSLVPNLSRRPLHFLSALSFLTFSFFLLLHLNTSFNCGIFIKLSINQIPQSLKIIIWYKKLSFGITIRSYLIRSFQNFLEEILTRNFFRSRSWFETFLYLNIGDSVGAPLKI